VGKPKLGVMSLKNFLIQQSEAKSAREKEREKAIFKTKFSG